MHVADKLFAELEIPANDKGRTKSKDQAFTKGIPETEGKFKVG
jgi:hypothetical protein